jgi:O-antigen ligase
LLVVSLYLLKGASVQAMSATSVGSLAGGLTLFIVLLRLRKFGTFPSSIFILVITIAVIVIGTLIVFKQGEGIDFVASSMGRDSTLTGRTDIWREFLPMAMKRPLLGHGFGGFWTDERFRLEWVNSVHNGYLEVILHLGFVGLVLVSLFLLSCCQRAREIMTDDFYWGSFWVCFLLMSIVHNIGESSCDSFSRTLTAIIVFFCVASSSMIKGSEKVKADRTIER